MLEPNGGSNVGAVVSTSNDRKKQVHLKCEKMRREAIKVGYSELKDMLPPESAPVGYKLTNASILYRAADFLKELKMTERQQCDEITRLHSQIVALKIICQNYAQMTVQENEKLPSMGSHSAPYLKFDMFRVLLDYWFESFDQSVEMDEYGQFAKSVLQWFEHKMDFTAIPKLFEEIQEQRG